MIDAYGQAIEVAQQSYRGQAPCVEVTLVAPGGTDDHQLVFERIDQLDDFISALTKARAALSAQLVRQIDGAA